MPKPTSDCRATERNHPWPMVRLGDVCEIEFGTRVRRKDSRGGDYPVYGGGGATFCWDTYNREDQCIVSRFAMSEECVRFVRGKFFLNDSGLSVRSGITKLSQTYLDWVLYSKQPDIYALGRGAAQKNLDVEQFADMEIPLPPLSEQKEIVARLERELAAVEKMKKGFEALAETAKQEFKAELKEVFEGLKRDGAGMRKIGDVCTEISTGPFGSSLHKNDYIVGGTPIINPMHIVGQRLIPTDNMAVDEKTIVRLSAYCLRENDVIIGRRGEMGRAALVTSREKGWLCGTGCFFLRLRANVSPRYFVELLCSDYCKSQMEHQAIGTTIPNLNHTILREIEMPMPELAEQEWVVGSVTALRAKMEKLEAKAQEGVAICETMRKAILKEAFEGID